MRRTIAALAVIFGALLGMPAAATPETSGHMADGCTASPPQISVGVDTNTATAKLTVTCTIAGLSTTIPVVHTASGHNCELPVVEVKPGPTPLVIEFTGSFACEATAAGTATLAQVATASAPPGQEQLKLDVLTTAKLEAAIRVGTSAKLSISVRAPGAPAANSRVSDSNSVTAEAKVGTAAVLEIVGSAGTEAEVAVGTQTTTKLSFGT
jgi:hypothetical protein